MWSQVNPLLRLAEPGFESNTNRLKIGDGVRRWNDLPYVSLDKEDDGVVLTTDVGTVDTQMIANRAIDATKIELASIDNTHIDDNAQIDVSKISGAVKQINGTVTQASTSSSVVRNITVSTAQPSGGQDGDVWMVYVP
jgi:hypothetical protein